MKILAIESSGPTASAAIWEDGRNCAEETGPFKVTHSETLMPLTAKVIEETSSDLSSIDYIAVSGGPGSFTGLRIGSATAKGLGLALNKPLVHVPTLDAMAYNFRGSDKLVVPIMDARRGQVYAGIYMFSGDTMSVLMENKAMSAADLTELLNEQYAGREVIFLGDGIAPAKDMIDSALKAEFTFAEGRNALQRASSVAALGAVLISQGKAINADDEAPVYLRPSQAERVRAEKLSESAK